MRRVGHDDGNEAKGIVAKCLRHVNDIYLAIGMGMRGYRRRQGVNVTV